MWFLSFLEGFLCAASFLLISSSSLLADSPPPIPLQPIILSLKNVKLTRYRWTENDGWIFKDLIELVWSTFVKNIHELYWSHRHFLLDIFLPVKFHFVFLSEFRIPSPPRSPRWKWSSWRPPRSWLGTWCVLTITTTTITTTITITNFYICQKRKEIKNVLVIVMAIGQFMCFYRSMTNKQEYLNQKRFYPSTNLRLVFTDSLWVSHTFHCFNATKSSETNNFAGSYNAFFLLFYPIHLVGYIK